MKDKPTIPHATGADAQEDAGDAEPPGSKTSGQATARPGKTPRRSPDAEGGQPVDELDLDGDGARQT